MANEHIERLKQLVEHGGGRWVSFQESEPEDKVKAYILFQAPLSQKLLMLPDDEFFTTNAVQEKIYREDKKYLNNGFCPHHPEIDLRRIECQKIN